MSRTTIGIGVASLFLLAACGAPSTGPAAPTYTSVPEKPAAQVELNVLDVAGNLQLTQGMIDEFAAANPDVVSKVNYTKATAPDMPGKLEAEQSAVGGWSSRSRSRPWVRPSMMVKSPTRMRVGSTFAMTRSDPVTARSTDRLDV